MNYRKLGGENIAEIGLGTWQLGSADWGNVNEQEAFGILDAYADAAETLLIRPMCMVWGLVKPLLANTCKQPIKKFL